MATIIRSLPVLVFFIILAFPIGMVALMVWVAMRTRTRAKIVAATPTSNVGFASDGYVEFEGQAQAVNGRPIKTPLTGLECVWYHAKLERWRRSKGSGNDEASWLTLQETTSSDPFLLKDGTGTCIVFPYGAEVTFTDRSVWFGSDVVPEDKNPPRTGPGDSAEGMLRVYGTAGKEYRYTEERIYAGDPLLVLGQFWTATWADEEEDDSELEGDAGGELSDTADEESEEEAAVAAQREAWDAYDREGALIAEARALTSRRITKPAAQPFMVSTAPQAKLLEVHDTGWKGALFVAVVPAGIAVLLLWLRFG